LSECGPGALLAAGGAVAGRVASFAERAGQRAMADDVAALIRDGGALACEAGTGTGKTLAYLVPLLAGGQQAIVSTGTRNLQDQLFFRDLPLVCDALGARARVALLKGRGNYLCLHRLHTYLQDGAFGDRRIPAQLARIRAWSAHTGSGDIAELDSVPEDAPAWRFATSTRDNCLGAACAWIDGCHLFEARRRAVQADVVVVNHHLLLAQLALAEEGGDLLPEAAVLVIDEAHQLPDLATEFFGLTLSSGQLLELVRDADLARRTEAVDTPELSARADLLERAVREMSVALEVEPRRVALSALRDAGRFEACAQAVEQALAALQQALSASAERGRGLAACAQRAQALAARLLQLRDEPDAGCLSWLDLGRRGFTWRRSPLDVGPLLGPRLLARHESVLFTSATLAVAGDLGHFCERVGVSQCTQRIYPSPFDHARQALLYLPRDMPEPRFADYAAHLEACIEEVTAASGGRAFALFTSHAALSRAHRALAGRLPYPVLAQGEAPRAQLLDRFRAAGNAVLFGTYSFWEGVDVRGDALSCVIIDKLPFAPPDDPLLQARHAALREQGRDPFIEQQLPQAAIALKQGVGRLIRDACDRGVVVVCDPRLHSRGYGRRLLASLPPMRLTRDIAQVRAFFQAEARSAYTAAVAPGVVATRASPPAQP
jgi:ATP-dependent DNA helicase DinG